MLVEVNATSPMLGWRLQLQFSIFGCSPTSFFLSEFTGQFTKGIWEDTRFSGEFQTIAMETFQTWFGCNFFFKNDHLDLKSLSRWFGGVADPPREVLKRALHSAARGRKLLGTLQKNLGVSRRYQAAPRKQPLFAALFHKILIFEQIFLFGLRGLL